MNHRDTEAQRDPLSERVLGAALEVHKGLGPGLLESAYQECLAIEFGLRNLRFRSQVPLPIVYKGHRLDEAYRLDFLVEDSLVVEIKSVEKLLPVHEAQLLTYLRLGGYQTGLLLNFWEAILKDGIRRMRL